MNPGTAAPLPIPPEEKYTVEYKKLKRGIKIIATELLPDREHVLEHVIKLTFPQWKCLGSATPFVHVPGRLCPDTAGWTTMEKLRDVGLTARVEYTHTSFDWQRRPTQNRSHVQLLTEMGAEIFRNLPKCPPEKDWPANAPSAKPSRENIRLTRHQKDALKNWPKRGSKAVPVGGSEPEEGRWVSEDHLLKATFGSLLRMELVEPGFSGLKVKDGRLVFDGESRTVSIMYRLTILGSLIAGQQ